MRAVAALGALLLLASTRVAAEDSLLHSDLPLWIKQHEVMWPRFSATDDGYGCISNIRMGDWKFELKADGRPAWLRFGHYGALECGFLVAWSDDRADLAAQEPRFSFLIDLGRAPSRSGEVELWALQSGASPGADYTLLARHPAKGEITAFDVLERECPTARMRRGPKLGLMITSYCAINSRRELVALARRMALRPAAGRLTAQPRAS